MDIDELCRLVGNAKMTDNYIHDENNKKYCHYILWIFFSVIKMSTFA